MKDPSPTPSLEGALKTKKKGVSCTKRHSHPFSSQIIQLKAGLKMIFEQTPGKDPVVFAFSPGKL
jgi:hypothetical protein